MSWEHLEDTISATDELCEPGNRKFLWEEVTSLQPLSDLADSFFAIFLCSVHVNQKKMHKNLFIVIRTTCFPLDLAVSQKSGCFSSERYITEQGKKNKVSTANALVKLTVSISYTIDHCHEHYMKNIKVHF